MPPRASRQGAGRGPRLDRDRVAAARPEAQRLIAEVDGLVEYRVHRGDPLGVTRSSVGPDGADFVISFDVGSLDGYRRQDRDVTVLHEYGHVIDLALVPEATNDAFEAGIPRTGACGNYGGVSTGACAAPAERFADTFAKWALRGKVSAVGAAGGQPALARGLGRAAHRPVGEAVHLQLAPGVRAGGLPCRPRRSRSRP